MAATRVPRYLAQTVTFPLLPSSDLMGQNIHSILTIILI